jgi:hypothetical protein
VKLNPVRPNLGAWLGGAFFLNGLDAERG